MRKLIALSCVLLVMMVIAAGCGETISGIGKDAKRIGKGVKTVFIREE